MQVSELHRDQSTLSCWESSEACDRLRSYDSLNGFPGFSDAIHVHVRFTVYTHAYSTHLIVVGNIVNQALQIICITPTVSHGPVQVSLDAFS